MIDCAVVPNLRACCFCLPLRWSTLSIAIIYMLLSLPLTVLFGTPIILNRLFDVEMEPSTLCSYYLIVLTLVFQFIAGVLLIIAVARKLPELINPWVWVSFCQGAGLVLMAAVCSFIYIYQVTKGEIDEDPEEAMTYAGYAVYGFVLYYATSVVNSYKRELYTERAARVRAEMAPLRAQV